MANAAAALELTDFSPLQEARTLSEVMAGAGTVAAVVIPEFRARNPRTDPAVFSWWLTGAVAEFFHQRVDAEARELQFGLSQRRSTVESYLRLLGQSMRPPSAAEVDVIVALKNGPSSTRDTPIPRYQGFETSGGVRFALFSSEAQIDLGLPSVRVRLMHGEWRREALDASDETRLQMRVTMAAGLVQNDVQRTITVLVGPSPEGPFEQYEVVDSLEAAGPTSAQVLYRPAPDGRGIFVFGDGVNGKIPPIGHIPFVSFMQGGGKVGNVAAGQISQLVGELVVDGDTVDLIVTQPLDAEGGRDAETVEQARARAPSLWKTQDRAVTLFDYEALARAFPGIVDARATRVGLDLVEVAIIGASASGVPSAGLRDALQAHLQSKAWDRVRVAAGRAARVGTRILVRAKKGNAPATLRPVALGVLDKYFDLETRAAAGLALFGDPTSTAGHAYESDLVGLFESTAGVENIDVGLFAREPSVEWLQQAGTALISAIDASAARASEEIDVRFAGATDFKVIASVSGDLGWGVVGETFESAAAGLSFLVSGAGVYEDEARFSVSPYRGPVKLARDEYFVKGAVDLQVVRA